MDRIKHTGPKLWTNLHESVISMTSDLITSGNARVGTILEKYNETAEDIALLLSETLHSQKKIRPCGGKWSITPVAFEKTAIIETDHLNLRWTPASSETNPTFIQDPKNLLFAQCGAKIKSLSIYLRDRKKSLKASGASNGQTIAGAISCGTHGSAIDFGSIHDSVVGLNIIVNKNKNYYIQRATKPIMNETFAASIQAKLINDDDLFNAAVVSMGCFGFIHGVMLETEDWFMLKNYTKNITLQDAELLMNTLQFDAVNLPTGAESGQRPYHFKLLFNPFNPTKNPKAEILYKKPGPDKYIRPALNDESTYPKDALGFIAKITQNIPGSDKLTINLLESSIFPKDIDGAEALLYDTFSDTSLHGKTFACAIGIPLDKTHQTLTSLLKLIDNHGSIPAIFALRFIKKSNALMAFSRFEHTCVFEIDGVRNQKMTDYIKRIPAILRQNNIPFTFHWGKDNPADQAMIAEMYGASLTLWINQKSKIMNSPEAAMFSNDYTDHLGLDDWTPEYEEYV